MSLRFDPESITGLLAVVTLPVGILAGMLFGGGAAGVVFVVGWLLLVPVSAILFDEVLDIDELELGGETDQQAHGSAAGEDTALATLRERYAAGDIDEEEFERRLDALLETEDLTAESAGDASVEREFDVER
jgi:uncharacterized membrane protein